MPAFETSDTLKSRSFVGLLLSQFLAAFNDHASQIVAIFYASDMLVRYVGLSVVDEKLLVAIVTACFITPFFFFSPVAGMLADKYSKRNIIVFWKLTEVAIMAFALLGFVLPHLQDAGVADPKTLATCSAWMVVATVFAMGTHSAFFVPAKYGVMPEILSPSVLSRGNGLLEGTSFVAQILGTAFGGFLYGTYKSSFSPNSLTPGGEWIIGLVLLGLAVVGAVASFLVERIPAAAPNRPLIWNPWVPLKASFAILKQSRSLILATAGIAFFLFMTLLLRQTLLFEGEAEKELQLAHRLFSVPGAEVEVPQTEGVMEVPQSSGTPHVSAAQEAEFRVAMLIALVGLGVGIGCSLAGYFSGSRLELGLVPIGASLLVLLTAVLAWAIGNDTAGQTCLVLIGVAAGLYIVPLYTLLQHRAPKESKGSLVALSNFLNVAGGLVAVVLFYFVTFGMQTVLGLDLTTRHVLEQPELRDEFFSQLTMQMNVPRFLFVFASLMAAGMLALLCRQRPDFVLRAATWLSSRGRGHLRATGLENVPGDGSLILVTNAAQLSRLMDIGAITDRFVRFFLLPGIPQTGTIAPLAHSTGTVHTASAGEAGYEQLLLSAQNTLERGHVVGVVLSDGDTSSDEARLLKDLRTRTAAKVLPVGTYSHTDASSARVYQHVKIGPTLNHDASLEEIASVVEQLGSEANLEPVVRSS